MTPVAILCASSRSVYHQIPGVDVYDAARDARTFQGGMPIVAHPPCRAWSLKMSHFAKPEEGERELGMWCTDKLRECGGVLEQPAKSRLFAATGLPGPGEKLGDLHTIEVWQAWWGFPTKKATWLCFSGIDVNAMEIPLRLHAGGCDGRRFNAMSRHQRAATTLEFAFWLVDAARRARRLTPTPKSGQ